jgi:hypothetical protein
MAHGPYPTPEGFTLAGYGVTLRVIHNFGGAQPDLAPVQSTIEVDREARAGIERELLEYQAGTGGISSCPIAAFVPKYVAGIRYLVFAGRPDEPPFGLFTTYRARVEGTDVILNGPTIPFDEQATLYVTAEQYHRFFDGVEADFRSPDFVAITADRVPLTSVLRYAASINGSAVRIAPPETGSAGLLDPSPATTTQR